MPPERARSWSAVRRPTDPGGVPDRRSRHARGRRRPFVQRGRCDRRLRRSGTLHGSVATADSAHQIGETETPARMNCVACRKDAPTVTDDEIAELHPQIPDWNIVDLDG